MSDPARHECAPDPYRPSSSSPEEHITPIGMLLVNPSAFHRRLLKIEGIADEVRPYHLHEVTSVCGARFKVTDATGTIEVSFRQHCQVRR